MVFQPTIKYGNYYFTEIGSPVLYDTSFMVGKTTHQVLFINKQACGQKKIVVGRRTINEMYLRRPGFMGTQFQRYFKNIVARNPVWGQLGKFPQTGIWYTGLNRPAQSGVFKTLTGEPLRRAI